MNDLSPREQAIVALALGRGAVDVARELDVPEAAVRRVGGMLGWPGDTRQLKRAASAIHAGQRLWAGELAERPDDVTAVGQAQPAPEATADEDDGTDYESRLIRQRIRESYGDREQCDECETTGRNCAAHRTPITDQGDPMPKPIPDPDALAVLADVDKLTTTTDRAVLTMPLARLVTLDGETVLVEAVVEVQLVPEGVLASLDGADDMPAVSSYVVRRLTPDGADAIRQLAALLPPDADR